VRPCGSGLYAPAAPLLAPVQRMEGEDRFFRVTGADIRHGGNMAYYAGGSDHVQMPQFETFRDAESYYDPCARTDALDEAQIALRPGFRAQERGRRRLRD
jgi:antirestriction protein ArdC